jgi:hypothetical protein
MSGSSDFRTEAARLRDMARRARRMAGHLSLEPDKRRLEDYAEELEAEAASCERRGENKKE